MITGIMCDDYKTAFYRKALKDNGYTYVDHPGLTSTTRLIKVETTTETLAKLALILKKLERDKPWFKNAGRAETLAKLALILKKLERDKPWFKNAGRG